MDLATAPRRRSVGRRIQKEHLQGGWNCVLRRARAIPAEQGKISGLIDFNRTRSFAWSVGRSIGQEGFRGNEQGTTRRERLTPSQHARHSTLEVVSVNPIMGGMKYEGVPKQIAVLWCQRHPVTCAFIPTRTLVLTASNGKDCPGIKGSEAGSKPRSPS